MESLLRTYFHEEWADDGGSAWSVVSTYAEESDLAVLLSGEIADALRDAPSEEQLRRLILKDLACGYDPAADGWTYRGWLTAVSERVEQQLPT
ncbi:MAG: contact-dependent growth inhibition system immunity protein [Actinomycetota bacterium]|nr:contact-dependent growth inhibition system immunity protein [Actinomycetota bacterium]